MKLRDKKKEKTLEEILDVSEAWIRDHGFQTLTMEKVAQAALLSRKTVYNYLSSREEILVAIANRRLRRWYENTRLHEEWAMDPLEKIQYIYRNLAREFKKERKLWRQIIGAGGFNYLVHPSQRSIMLGLVRCFREILQDGQRQNLISRQYPVELLAGYLNSAQSQLCMEWVMDWPNSYALARRLQTTLRLFFSGISAP